MMASPGSTAYFLARTSDHSEKKFRRYSQACAWLDSVEPQNAARGFETFHGGTVLPTGQEIRLVYHTGVRRHE